MTFTCSICGEPSTQICVRCTKDACPNHLCEKCNRCSDCCECEIALTEDHTFTPVAHAVNPPKPDPEPEPDAPQPPPDPDPFPGEPESGLRAANQD